MKGLAFVLITTALVMFITASCAGNQKVTTVTPAELTAAPEKLALNDTTIVLNCYLWRDFMPISPPDGKPLRIVITLLPENSETLPPRLDATQVWILYQNQIWSDSLNRVGNPALDVPLKQLEKMADGGPKWGPGVEVTVVVEVQDAQGKKRLLRAGGQMINRTD